MRIGIIGSGHIGGTLGRLWAEAGHEVMLSNSRGPASLAELAGQIGHGARAGTPQEAAAFGEVVLLAAPYGKYRNLPAQMAGKIAVDAMNYFPQRDGQIPMGDRASSELVAEHLPGARLVKAFNTIYFATLAHDGKPSAPREDRLVIFLAGDDPEAKRTVAGLIEQIGFAPVDTGSLHEGGLKQQPGSPIYNRPMKAAEAAKLLPSA